MRDNHNIKIRILVIITLLIISVMTPIVVGLNFKDTEENNYLENLFFICSDRYGSSKLVYCKEFLQKEYSFNDNVESDEFRKPEESLSVSEVCDMLDSAWPMQSHDPRHTGRSLYNTTEDPYHEKWRFYSSGSVDDSPVIDSDGTIYFKGAYNYLDRYLYAIYPDGTFKWRFKTDGLLWGSSPAIGDDGTIYVGSWDTNLYAINSNGTLKWKIGLGGSIASSPAIAEDGTIYVGTMNSGNSILAINPNGTIKWSYKTGYSVVSSPAIGDDGIIYCGSGDCYLYSLYPNGNLHWRFKTGDYIKGSPSIGEDGTVYIGSYDGFFYAINSNGTEKWKFNSGGVTDNCPAIGKDGTIYIGTDKLYAFNPNGSKKWTFNLGTDRWIGSSSPAISADGIIYVGICIGDGNGGEIVAINSDGIERWRKKIAKESIDSSPSIAKDGTIYIGTWYDLSKGYLHAFGVIEFNEPPEKPTISGKTIGKVGIEYEYKLLAKDPDNNPISFYIDWGDGNEGWTTYRASEEKCYYIHKWSEQGNYSIRVKAKDTLDEESDWRYFEVIIPRNKTVSSSWFLWFLERFPLLERLLSLLR